MNKNLFVDNDIKDLFKAFSCIEDQKERERFFFDLLSEEELKDIARRWKVARMLAANKTFSQIEAETGMSSTTIARISKWLKSGYGGIQILINKTKK